jgi:hypothetical protein
MLPVPLLMYLVHNITLERHFEVNSSIIQIINLTFSGKAD